MGKLLFVLAAVLASFLVAEALVCNKCSFSVFGVCLNKQNETCSTNTSVCFTGKATFPSLSSFSGFNSQGCRESNTCADTNGTLLGVAYNSAITCCTTDACNPTTITSGAPSTKSAFTAAAAVAVLVSLFSMQ